MSLAVDCFRTVWSIYYPPPLHTYRNWWIIPLSATFCRSYCVKYSSAIEILYKIKPYMPLCLTIRLIPLLLLLLHCSLSNGFSGFSPRSFPIIICVIFIHTALQNFSGRRSLLHQLYVERCRGHDRRWSQPARPH